MGKFERKSAEARRGEILSAALPLFAAKGFASTTTREIAHAAHVSDALLYKYFPSKESLYQALVDFCASRSETIGSRLERLEKSTLSFIRSVYFLMYVVRFGDPQAREQKHFLDRILMQDLLGEGQVMRDFHTQRIAPWIERLDEVYKAVIAAGEASKLDGSSTNRLWFAKQLALVMQFMALPGQSTIRYRGNERKVFDEAVLFALRGLGLSEKALARDFDADDLDAFVQAMFAEMAAAPRA